MGRCSLVDMLVPGCIVLKGEDQHLEALCNVYHHYCYGEWNYSCSLCVVCTSLAMQPQTLDQSLIDSRICIGKPLFVSWWYDICPLFFHIFLLFSITDSGKVCSDSAWFLYLSINQSLKLVPADLFLLLLKVYNAGPSTLPGSFVDISFPNRLSATGAEMFHIQQMMVSYAANLFFSIVCESWKMGSNRRVCSMELSFQEGNLWLTIVIAAECRPLAWTYFMAGEPCIDIPNKVKHLGGDGYNTVLISSAVFLWENVGPVPLLW